MAFWGLHTPPFNLLSLTLQCQYLVSSSCFLFSLAEPALLNDQSGLSALDDRDKKSSDAATAVVGSSLPLPVPNKPESVVSITSQCSYSSTIVHVGDKKPQPESGTVSWKSIYCQPDFICCCIFITRRYQMSNVTFWRSETTQCGRYWLIEKIGEGANGFSQHCKRNLTPVCVRASVSMSSLARACECVSRCLADYISNTCTI